MPHFRAGAVKVYATDTENGREARFIAFAQRDSDGAHELKIHSKVRAPQFWTSPLNYYILLYIFFQFFALTYCVRRSDLQTVLTHLKPYSPTLVLYHVGSTE